MASVSIADLTISIKDNSKQAAAEVTNLADACAKLRDSSKNTGLKQVASEAAQLKSVTHNATAGLQGGLEKSAKLASQVSSALEGVTKAYKDVSKAMKATLVDPSVQKKTAEAKERIQPILDQVDLNGAMVGWIKETQDKASRTSGFEKFKTVMTEVGNTAKSVFHSILPSGISRTLSQLGRLMKMRILRTIVKSILAGITEGLQNVYQWSKIMGDGFAATMDGMASSVLYLKNSIGAAFAQILSLVAPHINSLIDLIVEGINYINMFFAVLAGQSTYTRAKKVAVEYGKAVAGAAGGAAGAVKELKEELSVLDFDELHQLQEQPTPSAGGGGGGGGGGSAADYADMFEKADIEANWLTKTAGWLRENFDEVLGIVSAIGAGILAWKISTALADNITALKNLSVTQKLGITMMVTGFVLEATGAYNLGKKGFNLQDIIISGVGAALGIAGSVLAFHGALGLTLSIPLTIAIAVVGYTMGRADRILEELGKESESWKLSRKIIEDSVQGIAKARELYTSTLNSWESNITNTEEKFATGKELLRMFEELSSKGDLSSIDLTKLQGIQEAFNNLQLGDGLILEFERLDGAVESNVKEMQKLLEQYRLFALEAGYFQVIQESYEKIAEASVGLAEAQERRDLAKANVTTEVMSLSGMTGIDPKQLLSWIGSLLGGNYSTEEANKALAATLGQDFLNEDLQAQLYKAIEAVGALVTAEVETESYQDVIDLNTQQVERATKELEKIKFDTANISEAVKGSVRDTVVKGGTPAITAGVIGALGNLGGGVSSSATDSVEEYAKSIEDLTPVEQRQLALQWALNSGYKDLAEGIKQGGTIGQEYTAKIMEMIDAETRGATVVNDSTERVRTHTGALKLVGDEAAKTSSTIVSAFNSIKTGVDMVAMGKTMADSFTSSFSNVGGNVKTAIEKDMNGIGNGMQYATIMTNINAGLTTAQKATPFANIGVAIGGNMQSGSISGFNSKTIMTAYENGLTDKQKVTLFSAIGKAMGLDMQNGTYNGFSSAYIINSYLSGLTDKQKNALFSAVGTAMGDDMESGAWNSFSTWYIISEYLKGLTNAVDSMDFTPIGTTIAGDIKWGIQKSLNGKAINVTTSVGGITSTTKGNVWVDMTAAEGALGLNAGTVFIAGEAGAEAVGTIGGKTGVANRDQIASAIAQALRPMLGNGGGTTTTNVNVQMDSASVARAAFRGQNAMNKQYNVAVRS